jgi:2-hydroxychromene-2-carboxylate isomerase
VLFSLAFLAVVAVLAMLDHFGLPQRVLATTLAAAGFDADEFIALVGDPEVKAKLVATTEEAVARGVFGAPTFFVGEAMFFGQDRLDFVREALLAIR